MTFLTSWLNIQFFQKITLKYFLMGGYMDGWRSKRPLCDPSKKPLFFIEKMLRLLEIFLVKNSSPFFSKLVRVRSPNHYILLIGTIKPYNICYWHFLIRSFLREIFNDPFHQTNMDETNKTVCTGRGQVLGKKSSIRLESKSVTPCRVNTILISSTKQLPRKLRLRPMKGF